MEGMKKVLKFLGAVLVLVSSGLLGMELAKNLTRRSEELRQLQFGLQVLETEIIYGSTPLPAALKIVAAQTKGHVAEVFAGTARILADGTGTSAGEAWRATLEQKEGHLLLKGSDLLFLHQFGQGLGESDRDDQKKRLTMVKSQLKNQEEQSERERFQFQKVWQSLGWAVGMIIILFFM